MIINWKNIVSEAKIFKALGNNTRLAIIKMLLNSKDEICVTDLFKNFDKMSLQNFSAHLHKLEFYGLVKKRKNDKFIFYRINEKNYPNLSKLI
jgi:DNA-binding transcriptional ArsR family regulator